MPLNLRQMEQVGLKMSLDFRLPSTIDPQAQIVRVGIEKGRNASELRGPDCHSERRE